MNSGVLINRFLLKSFDFKGSSVQKQRPQNLLETLKFMKKYIPSKLYNVECSTTSAKL